jgi:hypothetical protein
MKIKNFWKKHGRGEETNDDVVYMTRFKLISTKWYVWEE